MKKIKVTNNSKRTKSRLGVNLKGGESTEVTVSSRDFFVLKAAKSFDVEVMENDAQNESSKQEVDAESENQARDSGYDFSDKNVGDTVQFVEDYNLDIDEAIETEKQGKNRSTVIDQLEEMKEVD